MTKANYAHLTLVVDRSGSMNLIRDEAQSGINELIKEHKAADGEMTFTLVQFDSSIDVVYDMKDIQEVDGYALVPRSMTALRDAIGTAIVSTGEKLAALDEEDRPSIVMFAIMTDGHENASQEYSQDQIKEMIKTQEEKYNWDFVFMGANIDAADVGSKLNINSNIQYASTVDSVKKAYKGLNDSTLLARSKGSKMAENLDGDYS